MNGERGDQFFGLELVVAGNRHFGSGGGHLYASVGGDPAGRIEGGGIGEAAGVGDGAGIGDTGGIGVSSVAI